MHHGLFLTGSRQEPVAYKKHAQFLSFLKNYCYLETVLTDTNLVFILAVDNKSQRMEYRMQSLC